MMSEDFLYGGRHSAGARVCVSCGCDFYDDSDGYQQRCEECLGILRAEAERARERVRRAVEELDAVLPLAE